MKKLLLLVGLVVFLAPSLVNAKWTSKEETKAQMECEAIELEKICPDCKNRINDFDRYKDIDLGAIRAKCLPDASYAESLKNKNYEWVSKGGDSDQGGERKYNDNGNQSAQQQTNSDFNLLNRNQMQIPRPSDWGGHGQRIYRESGWTAGIKPSDPGLR